MPLSSAGYRIFPVGDSALVIDYGNIIDISVHKKIVALFHYIRKNPPEAVVEAAPAYSSLYVHYDVFFLRKKNQRLTAYEQIKVQMEKIINNKLAGESTEPRLIQIPVCYDDEFGIDLKTIAGKKNISPDEIVRIHYSKTYHVFMLGFLPGFAYMGEVDEKIAVSRHQQPRKKIDAGSVGIAGKQTGIYPLSSPGGWQIIGRTPLKLFDAPVYTSGNDNESSAHLTLLQPGDMVNFYPINRQEYLTIQNEAAGRDGAPSLSTGKSSPGMTILKAGLLDTVQDGGRYGYQHLGINPGGAMDVFSFRKANILAGNKPGVAALELFFPAAEILFEQDTLAAVAGANFEPEINGNKTKINYPFFIRKGDVLRFRKPVSGNCCYLALHGGLDVVQWLGSASTNIKATAGGFCGRALKKGDVLSFHPFTSPPKNGDINMPFNIPDLFAPEDEKLFVVEGKEWESLMPDSKKIFLEEPFTITADADKMGYRLSGHPLYRSTHEEIVSSAVTCGTIQLLPDGRLIILMADHQTTGGYPAIAHVITAHHSRLAQKRPGDKIRFVKTDIKTAEELLLKQHEFLLQLEKASKFRLSSRL